MVGFTLVPFAVSILVAYAAWETITGIAAVWRMIAMTVAWIVAFAAGTKLFWKVVETLAQNRR